MSFAASVAALRTLFSVPDDAPLLRRPPPASASPPTSRRPKPHGRRPRLRQGRLARRLPRRQIVALQVAGRRLGKILSRNTDARKTAKLADGSTAEKNFNIFYEIDGEEVGSVLRADEYGGDEDFSWVLLEPAEGA